MKFTSELANFLDTVLGEATCYTRNPYGTEVKLIPDWDDVFFSINPMKDRRLDTNVTSFRNLLIEIDNMPLNEQELYVRSVLPVTSQVFSGSKSYHFIISLETPLPDIDTYRHTWLRMQKLLPKIDKACKNPSRLSRLPYRIRPETGVEQKLHFLGSRINTQEFLAMLPEIEYDAPKATNVEKDTSFISVNLVAFCAKPEDAIEQLGLAGRNAFFHYLGERLADLNLEADRRRFWVDLAYDSLASTKDFPRREAYAAARIRGRVK